MQIQPPSTTLDKQVGGETLYSREVRRVKLPSLRVGILWMLAGNIVYAGCQWCIVVVLTKLSTPETVGQFALAMAISTPVFLLFRHLNVMQITDAQHQYKFRDYFCLRIILALLSLIIITVLAALLHRHKGLSLIILLVAGIRAIDVVSDVFLCLLQQREKMRTVSTSWVLNGFVSVVAFTVLLKMTQSLPWAIAGSFTGSFCALIYNAWQSISLINNGRSKESESLPSPVLLQWRPAILLSLLSSASPLICTGIFVTLSPNVPRYFIAHYLGEYNLGIFAALASVMPALSMISSALNQSVTPRLAKYYHSDLRDDFKKILLRLIGIGLAIGLVSVLLFWQTGHYVLLHLFRAEYANYTSLFIWLMIAGSLNCVSNMMEAGIWAMKLFRIQSYILCFNLLIITLSCFVLVNSHGLYGAAWAMFLSSSFTILAYGSVIFRKMKIT